MTASRDHDQLMELVLREIAPEDGSPSIDVDVELLVGLIEGRASPIERDAVFRQLEASDEGRRLAATLVDLGEEGRLEPLEASAARAPRLPHLRPFLVAAAVLLLALGAGLWVGGTFDEPTPDPEDRLVAAARHLRETTPDIFEGFEPLSAEDLASPAPAPLRGGIQLLRPTGLILGRDLEFVWVPLAGVSAYTVRILDDEGREVVRAGAPESPLPWPKALALLEPGRTYVADIEADGPLGRLTGQRTFTVASVAQNERFAAARRHIEDTQPEDMRRLLLAHLAIRMGLLEEAERLLGSHLRAHAGDDFVLDTHRHVLRRLGVPSDE